MAVRYHDVPTLTTTLHEVKDESVFGKVEGEKDLQTPVVGRCRVATLETRI